MFAWASHKSDLLVGLFNLGPSFTFSSSLSLTFAFTFRASVLGNTPFTTSHSFNQTQSQRTLKKPESERNRVIGAHTHPFHSICYLLYLFSSILFFPSCKSRSLQIWMPYSVFFFFLFFWYLWMSLTLLVVSVACLFCVLSLKLLSLFSFFLILSLNLRMVWTK